MIVFNQEYQEYQERTSYMFIWQKSRWQQLLYWNSTIHHLNLPTPLQVFHNNVRYIDILTDLVDGSYLPIKFIFKLNSDGEKKNKDRGEFLASLGSPVRKKERH